MHASEHPPFWCRDLEKRLDQLADESHVDFRLYLSADPIPTMPVGLLQNCVKVTNEPPAGLKANLLRAFGAVKKDELEEKDSRFKSILFSLCFFHAVVMERRKFGSLGWNRNYPFAEGDLTVSIQVLGNYLEGNSGKIPWEDLRYLTGDVMYGGHITDDEDRRLCSTYLGKYFREELLDQIELYEGFQSPPPLSYDKYIEYINTNMALETPKMFGLHPNAELDFRTSMGNNLFTTMGNLMPRDAGGDGGPSVNDVVKEQLDSILEEKVKDDFIFDYEELLASIPVEERGPFQNFFLQEIERMNKLVKEIRRDLKELDLGLSGVLTTTDAMEKLMASSWDNHLLSLRSLPAWLADIGERVAQLQAWTGDLAVPKVTWLCGLFNPQAFITACQQVTARSRGWPLDKMVTQTDVTKAFDVSEVQQKEGYYYITGLMLEGCRWDIQGGALEESRMKEMFFKMPIMALKAVTLEKKEAGSAYECPVYKTQLRSQTKSTPTGGYVFAANLRSKVDPGKWIMAGVCLLMECSI